MINRLSHAVTAAALTEGGIAAAIECTAVITMNARILCALRHRAADDPHLTRTLADNHVTIGQTLEGGYLAALLVKPDELGALETHLLAIREDSVTIGFTAARVKYGFNRYAVDAAVESIQIAKDELAEGEQA